MRTRGSACPAESVAGDGGEIGAGVGLGCFEEELFAHVVGVFDLRLHVVFADADEVEEFAVVFEDKGVKIVVDNESLPYLQGSQIDFTTTGLNRTFTFDNPNATEECGCGESFTIS